LAKAKTREGLRPSPTDANSKEVVGVVCNVTVVGVVILARNLEGRMAGLVCLVNEVGCWGLAGLARQTGLVGHSGNFGDETTCCCGTAKLGRESCQDEKNICPFPLKKTKAINYTDSEKMGKLN
jgi:hypothetical protein